MRLRRSGCWGQSTEKEPVRAVFASAVPGDDHHLYRDLLLLGQREKTTERSCFRRTRMLHRGVRARVRVVCVCGLGTEDAGGEELRRRVKIPAVTSHFPVGNARPTSLHLLQFSSFAPAVYCYGFRCLWWLLQPPPPSATGDRRRPTTTTTNLADFKL